MKEKTFLCSSFIYYFKALYCIDNIFNHYFNCEFPQEEMCHCSIIKVELHAGDEMKKGY